MNEERKSETLKSELINQYCDYLRSPASATFDNGHEVLLAATVLAAVVTRGLS